MFRKNRRSRKESIGLLTVFALAAIPLKVFHNFLNNRIKKGK